MKQRAYKLMKEWCDTLLKYQVKANNEYTNNALLCPACHVIHGRIADLCFPFAVIWDREGDESYLKRADELIDFSENNLKTMDGMWYNDITNRWVGTSAFSAMSIGEALFHFGERLPKYYYDKWFSIYKRIMYAVETLDTREGFRPVVVNYYCGVAASLALAWRLTGEEHFYEKSRYWTNLALSQIDEQGILYGEGFILKGDDGSAVIDMGYNLEESIPLLLRYGALTGEREELFRALMHSHIEFLLPDGAIDNSFGTRHNKWTYWGSRTSDGLVEGLALTLDDPVLKDACERVLTLYEKCTHDGLLAMPMAHEVGEPTCLHHTFTHAKALAVLVCYAGEGETLRGILPAEKNYGIKKYQNGKLILASNGVFRATFSAIRATYLPEFTNNGGGSMNLLYHKDYGIICAATSKSYAPTEPLNQQYLRNSANPPCMTAQFIVDGKMGCSDREVEISAEGMTVTASARKWRAEYTIKERSLEILLTSENGIYNLPIVCSKNSKVELSPDRKTVTVNSSLTVKCDTPLTCDPTARVFHQVGGLLYLPISIPVSGKSRVEIIVYSI